MSAQARRLIVPRHCVLVGRSGIVTTSLAGHSSGVVGLMGGIVPVGGLESHHTIRSPPMLFVIVGPRAVLTGSLVVCGIGGANCVCCD
jgi:hypothetical protein